MNNKDYNEDNFKEFISIIQNFSSSEAYRLIRQILTEKEFTDISKRWEIAKMLHRGITQRHISTSLGVSLCKITRGSRELKQPYSLLKKAVELQVKLQKEGD